MTTNRQPQWNLAFLASLGFTKMDPMDVIDPLKAIGYQGIEWTTEHFDPDLPIRDLKRLVNQTRDAGLDVSRIMAHEDLVSLNDQQRRRIIDRTVRVIEAAGECQVNTVGTMTGPACWDLEAPVVGTHISESSAWQQVFEAYEAFLLAAQRCNVIISSEGVFGMLAHDFYTHRFLMQHATSPYHKVNFDPSHGVLYNNLDVGWIVRQWGDQIAHVHLKDAVGHPVMGEFIFPLLGEGRVAWTDLFTALDELNYNGFCSIEYESFDYYRSVLHDDPVEAARLSYAQVQKLLQQRERPGEKPSY